MRKSVLSLFISFPTYAGLARFAWSKRFRWECTRTILIVSGTLFLVFNTSALAVPVDEIPGYVNERYYPESVKRVQENPSWWENSYCRWFGSFLSIGCQGVRTQHILAPDKLRVDVDEEARRQDVQDPMTVLGDRANSEITSDQKAVMELLEAVEQELDSASTEGEVLGIQEFFNSIKFAIFGGPDSDAGVCQLYTPNNISICDDQVDPEQYPEKLAIALLPASLQKQTIAQRPSVGQPTGTSPFPEGGDITNPNATSVPIGPPVYPFPTAAAGQGGGNDLVVGFQKSCIYEGTAGRVHKNNVGCLYDVFPRLSFGVVPELRNSALAYTDLQCVGFVRGMNLQFKGQVLDNGGNANMFATNIPTGYQFVLSKSIIPISPKVGDLLLWNTGAFGHIAYVSVVHDTNRVGVIEANWGTPGKVQYRNINVRAADILGWLTK